MNRSVFLSAVASLILGAASQGAEDLAAANVDSSLMAWWKLDGANSGAAIDYSGWERHGILRGSPRWVPGCLAGALQVDGVDDCVETSYAEDLSTWTVSTWVQSPASPAATWESGPVHREANYQLNWNHRNARFRGAAGIRIGDTWYPASFGALSANTWYHLAATFDGTALRAYVNGTLITTNSAAQGVAASEPATLTLGRHACWGNFFHGLIDDVRIYRRALTADEIQGLVPGDQRVTAQDPQPANGANLDVRDATALSWSAGDSAVMHDIYLGPDAEAVSAANVTSLLYRGRQTDTHFSLAGLIEIDRQYFWRIDEVEADGMTIHKGAVWTFTIPPYLIVDEFEGYTDDMPNRLFDTWIDGRTNGTGSRVGNPVAPFAERDIVHEGTQAMSVTYNNTSPPFYSETQREFSLAQDWTVGDANTLSLWFRGNPIRFAETSSGAVFMSATGEDIWGGADQFSYAYRRLLGNGSIVARVDSLVHTNDWAKAGVMIRESLDPSSAHAFMLVTGDGRLAFQNRPTSYSSVCLSAHGSPWTITLPYWVKLQREGNQFTGYYSADGVNWTPQLDTENTGADSSPNPQTIHMGPNAYVGLALTSHTAAATTIAEFSQVTIAGLARGPWQVADIGVDHPGNSPDDLYVVVEDCAGATAMAIHPDPWAVTTSVWTRWEIPFSHLPGVDLREVRKLSIGVGAPDAAIAGATGRIYIDDIHVLNR